MGFLLFVLLVIVLMVWWALRNRIAALESQLSRTEWRANPDLEIRVRELTKRVFQLERAFDQGANVSPVKNTKPEQPSSQQSVKESPEERPIEVSAVPSAEGSLIEVPQIQQPRVAPPTPFPVSSPPPRPTWLGRLRQSAGNEEWEGLVAGNILNKIGALVLVIGIALFLGYSFTRMSAAGRASISALISLALLGTGVLVERRQGYRIFSAGLIGAGWAAAYITSYSIYALPAARVIESPFAGSVVLLAVAAAMIAHSLRYRVQAITSVAYFTAFGALAVTPSTPFATASLIPLAASLLYFAWRFRWHAMALFGLIATYGTCISRANSNAPLYVTETLFIIYWALFESFDILRARRKSAGFGMTWIFPLNTIAFLGLSYRAWSVHAELDMWRMAALSSALFLLSAVLRFPLPLESADISNRDPLSRVRAGSYEAPLTISSVLAGLAILGRVPGLWATVFLACEAEIIYLAGVRFRSQFLRGLGGFGFVVSLGKLLSRGDSGLRTSVLSLSLHRWTPPALFSVFLFYLNRILWRPNWPFSFAASTLFAVIIASETNQHLTGICLLAFALILFEVGVRKALIEFRIQAYLAALSGVMAALLMGHFGPHPSASIWGSCAVVAIECWLFTARILLTPADTIDSEERARVRDFFAAIGSLFAAVTLWMVLPGWPTCLAWTALALTWIQVGFALEVPSFRWIGNAAFLAAYSRLLGINLFEIARTDLLRHLMIPLVILMALYYLSNRLERSPAAEEQTVPRVYSWLAAVLALRVTYLAVNPLSLAPSWAALAILYFIAGLRTRSIDFRAQSYCVTLLVVLRCFSTNFVSSESLSLAPRIVASSICVALFLVAQFLAAKNTASLTGVERHARPFFSLVAVLLLTGLLFHEVSGSLLTMAWGFEGLACLSTGFALRERILRLEGLGVLLLCILKLFLYDLRNLETVYRILTFVALGLILLAVSWIYTRFRIQIRRYL